MVIAESNISFPVFMLEKIYDFFMKTSRIIYGD